MGNSVTSDLTVYGTGRGECRGLRADPYRCVPVFSYTSNTRGGTGLVTDRRHTSVEGAGRTESGTSGPQAGLIRCVRPSGRGRNPDSSFQSDPVSDRRLT